VVAGVLGEEDDVALTRTLGAISVEDGISVSVIAVCGSGFLVLEGVETLPRGSDFSDLFTASIRFCAVFDIV
jgi:hypothetical protein